VVLIAKQTIRAVQPRKIVEPHQRNDCE